MRKHPIPDDAEITPPDYSLSEINPDDYSTASQAERRSPALYQNHKGEKLTVKQEAFAQLVAEGKNKTEAYRAAYNYKGKNEYAHTNASVIAAKPQVRNRIAELLKEKRERNSARLESRAEFVIRRLTEIAENGKTETSQVRALQLLGQTVNVFKPDGNEQGRKASIATMEKKLASLLGGGKGKPN